MVIAMVLIVLTADNGDVSHADDCDYVDKLHTAEGRKQ